MSDPARLAVSFSLGNPRIVLAIASVALVLVAPGVFSLRVETSTESVLDKSSESWLRYQSFLLDFGSDEYISFLVRSSGNTLEWADLDAVEALTLEIASVAGIDRVDSLSTVPALLVGRDGALLTEPLVSSRTLDQADLRELLRRHQTAEGWLVSSDRKSYGVSAAIKLPVEQHYTHVLTAVTRASDSGHFAVSGVPIFRAAADQRMRDDLFWYVPVTVGVVSALIFLLVGSWGAIVAALVAPIVAVWVTLGAMGAFGVPLSITTVVMPPVVLALGCAYAMHALCSLREDGGPGQLNRLCDVAKPIALSGLTTAIGFLGLAAVRIEAINVLGLFGALSIALLTAATLTVTPAVARVLGVRVAKRPWDEVVVMQAMKLWIVSEKRSVGVIAVWALIVLVGCAAATRVDVSTNVIAWFGEEDKIRSDYEEIRESLAGITPLAVVLEAGPGEGPVTNPGTLRQMGEFLNYMRSLEGVGHALGLSDFLGQLRSEIGSGGGSEVESSAEAEQLLLLLEGEPVLNGLLAPDRRSAAVLVRLDNNDSAFIRELGADAERWWSSLHDSSVVAEATGVMMEFAQSQDEIVYGQLRGLVIALAAIALVVLATFRSLALASICMFVNLLPLLLAVGCLWVLDAPMDAATAVITCLSLGIAVDDSLHLMYQRERRKGDADPGEAGIQALRVVARPVVFSTVAVVCGFMVLGGSGFLPVSNLGLVTAGTMVICMLADLTLMPALLRQLDR